MLSSLGSTLSIWCDGEEDLICSIHIINRVVHTAEKRTTRIGTCFQTRTVRAIRQWIVNPTVVNKAEAAQYLLNILFFISYGLLAPWKDNWKRAFVTALALSVFIELSQFIFTLGWFEVNDASRNSLGAMIGWGAIRQISRRISTLSSVGRKSRNLRL